MMGQEGIPARIAALDRAPLRFAKGEGNHKSCPYVAPLCLRHFPNERGKPYGYAEVLLHR